MKNKTYITYITDVAETVDEPGCAVDILVNVCNTPKNETFNGITTNFLDITWSMLQNEDEIDGMRFTYRNPNIFNLDPAVQDGTKLYTKGVDYDIFNNGLDGVIKFKSGKGFYDGEFVRLDNFKSMRIFTNG